MGCRGPARDAGSGSRPGSQLPIEAAYTLTRSAFQTAFSSEFAGWGDVMVGDELPYLPVHQVSVAATVVAPRWQAGASAQWHGEVRDVAGQGAIDVAERGDALLTIGLSAHAQIGRGPRLYATCDNLLDEQVIVSRRPYGARPNPPRRSSSATRPGSSTGRFERTKERQMTARTMNPSRRGDVLSRGLW